MYYWDSVGDFFHAVDNERKREEYRVEYSKLLKYVNKKIPKEEELYNNLKQAVIWRLRLMSLVLYIRSQKNT
ncbi:hypothetical protein R2R35_06870 [Anaerocolumna sp. AGMB13020]|uniref:hypothetical protein n=1 Tax=Anaerocolumna sp. AGMB13020 TaxID=3081750 RepID=UPI002955A73C|nr:hypothetical protein [Anaerocolumna sp. AGMB13020]WOO38218.1 hypothetical protein R2R35_06870 [Anaerocolumna sp. AGMB13020]